MIKIRIDSKRESGMRHVLNLLMLEDNQEVYVILPILNKF